MTSREEQSNSQSQQKERLAVLVSYALVSLMMACLVEAFVQFGEVYWPGWDGAYLVFFGFLLSLEALYSQRILKGLYFSDPRWAGYRAAELVTAMLVLKVFFYARYGFDLLFSDLPLWGQDFFPNFFTGEYIFGFFIAIFVWFISTRMSSRLVVLEVDQRIINIEAETGIFEPRAQIRSELANDILYVGVGMILIATIMRYDRFVAWIELPPIRASVYNILAYFFLALVLLSITQFNRMRAVWLRDASPVQADVSRRWFFYSLVFILFLALIAGVLPTGYTVGLLALLNYLVYSLFAILSLLLTLVMTPILFLIGLLSNIFGGPTNMQEPQPFEMPQFTQPPPQAQGEPVIWWEYLKSALFWLVLIGIIVYAIVYYLREHRSLVKKLRSLPLFTYLARFWEWMGAWVGGINSQISAAVDAGLERLRTRRERSSKASSWRFVNPRRLSPREQVLFYFLAMVRRGQERGVIRRPSQTPFEYSKSLSGALDPVMPTKTGQDVDQSREDDKIYETVSESLREEISGVTDKFVEARYSSHRVTSQDSGMVKRYWQRIRRALRRPLQREKD